MLNLILNNRGKLIIKPRDGLDPTMTAADLFRDGPIIFQIFEVRGLAKKVQVGIEAPQELRVLRGELSPMVND
jgi:hypothetical protein